MMQTAVLQEFLTQGTLGPITTGCSREEVRAICGDPEDVSDSCKTLIWKYGSLQIWFALDRGVDALDFIGLYFREAPFRLPLAMQTEGWWPSVGTQLIEVREQIVSQEIRCHENVQLRAPDQFTLTVGIGVSVTFGRVHDQWILDSMQYLAG